MLKLPANNFADYKYKDISVSQLCEVIELIIGDKQNHSDICTDICFQIFQRIFLVTDDIVEENIDNLHVNRFSTYIKLLLENGKLSQTNFCEKLHNFIRIKNIKISLTSIWWLDNNNLFFFEQYCSNTDLDEVLKEILTLYNKTEINTYLKVSNEAIASYLLTKTLVSANLPSCTQRGSIWSSYCQHLGEKYLQISVKNFFTNIENCTLLQCIRSLNKMEICYDKIIKQFFNTVLRKLFTYEEKSNLNEAWLLQELWSSNRLSNLEIDLYYEILRKFNLNELDILINSLPSIKINWRNLLALFSVYVQKIQNGHKQLKDLVQRKLKTILNLDKLHTNDNNYDISIQICSVFLLARQACLEQSDPYKAYSEWYANTFGMNSNLLIETNLQAFQILLNTLTIRVDIEPLYALRVHIQRSLRVPPGGHQDMLLFKNVCRMQLKRTEQSVFIDINEVNISVRSLLEIYVLNNELMWSLRQPEIRKLLLPYIVADEKYNKIKNLLLSSELISSDLLQQCQPVKLVNINSTDMKIISDNIITCNSDSEEIFCD